MKLLLNGKKRNIYFRKNNTAYYKSKGSEIDITNYFKKKGGLKKQYVNLLIEKKLVGGVTKTIEFVSKDIFTKAITFKKSNIKNYTSSSKMWNTETIKDIYTKLLYVFIICKLNYNISGKLFKDDFNDNLRPNATIKIKKIIRILNGDIFKFYFKDHSTLNLDRFRVKNDECGNKYIELSIDYNITFNIEPKDTKDTIDLPDNYYINIITSVTFEQIRTILLKIFTFKLNNELNNNNYKECLGLEKEKYNLDLLKFIMINEGLFEELDTTLTKDEIISSDTLYCERNAYLIKIKNEYFEMFNHKKIDLTDANDEEQIYIDAINKALDEDKNEEDKFINIWDQNSTDDVLLGTDNKLLYTDEYNKLYVERNENGDKYNKLINNLILQIRSSRSINSDVKQNNILKLDNLNQKVIIKSSSGKYFLLQAYNEYLNFHIDEIEQTIGRVLTTYLSIRNNTFNKDYTQITDVITGENKRKTVKFGGKDYNGFNEIFGTITNNKITQTDTNEGKFNKMKILFNKLATSNLAILVFGYGYSGSGKTYTLFGERETKPIITGGVGDTSGPFKVKKDPSINLPSRGSTPRGSQARGSQPLLSTLSTQERPITPARQGKRPRTPVRIRPSIKPKSETPGIVQYVINHLIDTYKSSITIECIYELYNDNYNILNALSGNRNPYDELTKGSDIYSYIPNINERIYDNKFPIMNKFYNPTTIYTNKIYTLGNIIDIEEKPSESLYIYSEKIINNKRIINMNGPFAVDQFQDNKYKFETENIKEDFIKIYEKINTFRIQNNRIMPTANNPTSSRGHLFIDLKIETAKEDKVYTSYLTICDMGGRENPNDLLLGTKIYNILHNESTAKNFDQRVYRPHIISKDEKTMYTFIRKDKDIIPQINITNDNIKNKLSEIRTNNINERYDEYPGILQLYKSFYTHPTIVEFFYLNTESDFKLNQQLGVGGTNQQNIQGTFSNFTSQKSDNSTKLVNFYKKFFKCIKQGFYINDSINQLLLKFDCNTNYKPSQLTVIINTGTKRKCDTTKLKVFNGETLKKKSVRKTAVTNGFNNYGWYVNSLPNECIQKDVFKDNKIIRNAQIYRNSYLQYDPNKISEASKLEKTNIGIAELYNLFGTTDNIPRKYVVIGCIRDNDKFIEDDKISLKFLNTVSTSKLTDDIYSESNRVILQMEPDEVIDYQTGLIDDDEDMGNYEENKIKDEMDKIEHTQNEYTYVYDDEDRKSVISLSDFIDDNEAEENEFF